MKTNFKRGDGCFFKKKPVTEDTPPNAEFLRDMGVVQGADTCEIKYHGELWIVRYSEVKSPFHAMKELGEHWASAIAAAGTEGGKEGIAKRLSMSVGTLKKKMRLANEWASATESTAAE